MSSSTRFQAMISRLPQGRQITSIIAIANEPEPADEAGRLRHAEAVKIRDEYVRVSNLSRWKQLGELRKIFDLTEAFYKKHPS